MPETVALRFRDLESKVDTIEEHKKLIALSGYVWWGWWRKKESEPDQHAVIQELAAGARERGIRIGLFDGSTNRYFFATAADFILNSHSRGSPERSKTPSYYSSKEPEAWIKLQSIQDISKDLFIDTFGGVPVGERTFFPISGKVLPRGPDPDDFIRLQSDNVLHISDVHFGVDYGFPPKGGPGKAPIIDRLKHDVDIVCGGDIGLVIVSGDIGSRGDANALLVQGLDFLDEIHRTLRVPKEAVLVIPGNHDFQLLNYRPVDFSHERPFNVMLKEFYGNYDPDRKIKRFIFPSGRHAEFLLINSVRLRKTEEANYGFVEWSLYDSRLKAIGYNKDITRVAVLHHHLVSIPREELLDEQYPHAGMSTTIDSGAVIEGLQAHGFRLALHGHQHVPGLARISRAIINGSNEAEQPNDLEILAAGSAGAKVERLSNSMRDNSCNFLKFTKEHIQIEARRYNSGMDGSRYFVARLPY